MPAHPHRPAPLQFCAIRSYLATAVKHGIGIFNTLLALAEGHAWLPETT